MTMMHDDDRDHDVWLRCFTAALAGSTTAGQHGNKAKDVAEMCGQIADAALDEERKRRRGAQPRRG
jgi:hypothetical protein